VGSWFRSPLRAPAFHWLPTTVEEYHDKTLPAEGLKVAHFCSYVWAEVLLDEDH